MSNRKKVSKLTFYLLVVLNVGSFLLSYVYQNIALGIFSLGFALYLKRISVEVELPKQFQEIINQKRKS